ncbi:hypothetical protein PpBr36_06870 [Pyricularia pennisetigena]|uniref:hypothetical protein n=1 Tax=Pyricularia pennisetigena TaxID=1578925 RepID=UPI00115180DC|nr:hypothetical protein PpBr36_06870 [Pyricularia pennisetigena]TLS25517.1 hypothetical protein PpBr36_06870 [Pyricularia pennisetigena]
MTVEEQAPKMAATVDTKIPHLAVTNGVSQLVVKGKPMLMLAGELQNSSLTSGEYMDTVWAKLRDTHINTILGCVTWEMIEPEEDRFDFEELDKVILGARKHGIHLVLLWFGSFKNGISTYAPAWVKTNPKRFPRAKLRKAGGVLETADVVSIFRPEAREADKKAFGKLMSHIKEFDEEHSTVVMMQVENETGLLGDSRDGSVHAEKAFKEPVPADLIDFLKSDWANLRGDLKSSLEFFKQLSEKDTPSGSWEEVFGKSPQTDELFMAYNYARYLSDVASAGKAAYPIPMYCNVWQNYNGDNADNSWPIVVGGGDEPGVYPSGGGTSNVLDVWQRFATSLDFVAPDVYLNDYESSCAAYKHRGQALFIPEQRRDEYGARRIWVAYGSYGCMGTAPFGIDTLEPATNPFTRHYGLLDSVAPIVLEAQRNPGSSVGFYFDELPDSAADAPIPGEEIVRHWGGYEVTIERCFVFGRPGPGAGMVIHQGGGRFLLIGWGFQVRAKAIARAPAGPATFTGILSFKEKKVVDAATGRLETLRVLNGDETRSGTFAMMPNEDPDYGGFPICVTIPARTMVAELEFYWIEEDE